MSKIEEYRHPKWQEARLKTLLRDEFKCLVCQSKEKTLHVHHKVYKKNRPVWESEQESLITLCEDCHEKVEEFVAFARMRGALFLLAFTKWLSKDQSPSSVFDLIARYIKSSLSPDVEKEVREALNHLFMAAQIDSTPKNEN